MAAARGRRPISPRVCCLFHVSRSRARAATLALAASAVLSSRAFGLSNRDDARDHALEVVLSRTGRMHRGRRPHGEVSPERGADARLRHHVETTADLREQADHARETDPVAARRGRLICRAGTEDARHDSGASRVQKTLTLMSRPWTSARRRRRKTSMTRGPGPGATAGGGTEIVTSLPPFES